MGVIYFIVAGSALSGPITLPVVPGIGIQVPDDAIELDAELVTPEEGYAWALVDGEPVLLPDHRGVVYRTDDGVVQQHVELGALPEGLTVQARPGQFYVWGNEGWVLNEIAQMEATKVSERAWRNSRISITDYLVLPDYPITADQRSELYAYRQALRDWPDTGPFPSQVGRPDAPIWITNLPE